MAEKSNDILVSFSTLEWGDLVLELLSDGGRYSHSFKLRENLNDSATRFKVEGVFQRYYDGNEEKLRDEIHFRRRQCLKTIANINRLYQRINMLQVRDRDALADLLLDENRRNEWRRLVKKHQKKDEIVPLQFIEKEYREKLAKKAP